MPSAVPHIVVPTLLALAVLPIARRRILAWAPLTWAPDLDFFFAKEAHRALLSNIWIPLYFAGFLLVLWRRRDPTARLRDFAVRPGAPANLLLVVFYLSSHILMDLFAGGVVLFWPLLNRNFYWFIQVLVDTETGQTETTNDVGTEVGPPEITPVYEWFSPVDAAIVAVVLAASAAWLIVWWIRRASIQKE